jgi:hypothetical protein
LSVRFHAPTPFQIDRVEKIANDLNLYFTAVAGKSYALEFLDSLTGLTWSAPTLIFSNATTTNAVFTLPITNSQRFYRLENLTPP